MTPIRHRKLRYGGRAMTTPKPSPERGGCDHKFIDSAHCIKCGWVPPKTTRIGIVPAEPVAGAELTHAKKHQYIREIIQLSRHTRDMLESIKWGKPALLRAVMDHSPKAIVDDKQLPELLQKAADWERRAALVEAEGLSLPLFSDLSSSPWTVARNIERHLNQVWSQANGDMVVAFLARYVQQQIECRCEAVGKQYASVNFTTRSEAALLIDILDAVKEKR